ncbi:hypothetical protein [Streptomyces bambusae]|uniref:Uncharacterized protein n=1 Tax=Streptomyces bambusae TaxID=1550616 RepID=A0ABS6Z4K5_9ACTN|nr:hypothetical protein [Streptomyces bambusae]MBW5482491.1 hypothetical protein [Streptomyces bambusae]
MYEADTHPNAHAAPALPNRAVTGRLEVAFVDWTADNHARSPRTPGGWTAAGAPRGTAAGAGQVAAGDYWFDDTGAAAEGTVPR